MAWDAILGQEFAKRILQAHLADGRVAHAYLLAGPDGVGKRLVALEMAKALNCAASGSRPPGSPSTRAMAGCDACSTCLQINRGGHPDVHVLSPAGASEAIRIDAIRQLLGRIALRPFNAAFQVAIIDGAERLTEEAANSVLKALEEPPAHTRFVLTTSRLSDCLPTVVSRCQLVRCQPLPLETIMRILIERASCAADTARAIAALARGSASKALELAGRWEAREEIAARLASPRASVWVEQPLPETRQEVGHLLEEMSARLRDLAVAAAGLPAPAAQAVDADRCLETALELISLRESLDQFVSPRLVASLAREKWMDLNAPPIESSHWAHLP